MGFTIRVNGQERQLNPAEVAVIEFTSAPPGDFRVDANRAWTDTGITVRRGERITFNGQGHVMLAEGISSGVDGTTAISSANYPMRSAPAGMLIGRVGNSAPFVIGSQTELTMPASGRLMLGVNDDHHVDNTGYFSVGVAPSSALRR